MAKRCTTLSRIVALSLEDRMMVFRYFPDTDMLYIELLDVVTTESEEVAPNIVLDYDESNRVVGIEIEDASRLMDVSRIEISSLPLVDLVISNARPTSIPERAPA